MTKELTTQSTVLVRQQDVANGPDGLPGIQATMLTWAREKLAEMQLEEKDMRDSYKEAREHKWKCSPLLRAANKALERVQFYEKVIAALEAGFMLFPPIDNVDVIAFRTVYERNRASARAAGWRPNETMDVEHLPVGEGEYKDPVVHWHQCGTITITKKRHDGTTYTEEAKWWVPENKIELPEFPLVMARAQCIEATSQAMEQKFFDDIALYPARASKDPVILGRIHDPKGRILNFLISWRVDKRDL